MIVYHEAAMPYRVEIAYLMFVLLLLYSFRAFESRDCLSRSRDALSRGDRLSHVCFRLVFKCGSPHLNANANAQNDSNVNANANAQHLNQMQMQMQVRSI